MPASSAPRASAVLASCDSAPKLMSETKIGMSSHSGRSAFGPMHTSVPTALVVEQREAGELRGHELDVVPGAGGARGTRPWPPPDRGGRSW